MGVEGARRSKAVQELRISFQYVPTEADIGPLLSAYGDHPDRLARKDGYSGYETENTLKITVERTHDWEHELTLSISGSEPFVDRILPSLAERTGNWIAAQYDTQQVSAVRLGVENEHTAVITAEEADGGRLAVDAFNRATETDTRVVIEFE